MNVQVRLTRDWCDVSGVYSYISAISSQMAVFHHQPEQGCNRRHYHMYAFGVKQSEATLRNFLKKQPLYDLSGIPEWSLKLSCGRGKNTRPIDLSGAWIYGSKGTIPDAFNLRKNISPVQVEALEVLSKAFWAGGEVVLNGVTIKKPSDKKKSEDKYDLVDQIVKDFEASHKCDRNCDESQHLHKIYEIAIRLLRARRIRWHSYDLDRYVLPAFTSLSRGFTTDMASFISACVKKNLKL